METNPELKVVHGTNGRYYVTADRKVIKFFTGPHAFEEAWEYIGEYESFLQDQAFAHQYPGLI